MDFWLRCEAYFSDKPHDGPFWLWIRDGRIHDIRNSAPENPADPLVCKPDVYLLPLLSDSHIHCYLDPWPLDPVRRKPPGSGKFGEEVAAALHRLQVALRSGIGLVRDMGDPLGINLEARRQAQLNPRLYPCVQVSGPAIHRTGRYGKRLGRGCTSLEEALECITSLAIQDAVDFIKIVATGIVDFATNSVPGAPQFSGTELREMVNRASSHGLRVVAHCSGIDGIDTSLSGGVQFIEHGYHATPDHIRKMRDAGTCWTPTFAPLLQQAIADESGWDATTRQSLHRIIHQQEEAVQLGYENGVRLLAGTDAGSPGCQPGEALFRELECLSHCMPVTEALRCATSGNADSCQHPGYTGRIRKGDPASFTLYQQPPWMDLASLAHPTAVYQYGVSILSSKNASHAST